MREQPVSNSQRAGAASYAAGLEPERLATDQMAAPVDREVPK